MRTISSALIYIFLLLGGSAQVFAQTPGISRANGPSGASQGVGQGAPIMIEAGAGRVVQTSRPIANLFAADPKIAEVRPASPTTLFVFGVTAGRTTIAALDQSGGVVAQYDVIVRPSSFGAHEASAQARSMVPGTNTSMQATPQSIVMNGQVPTAGAAEQIASVAKGYLADKQTLDNRMSVAAPIQVNLRVRIAEISRDVTRRFGINWSALGTVGKYGLIGAAVSDVFTSGATPANTISASYAHGNNGINAVLDVLASDNLATILAEPNLTAMSGETASFLAGGEYPIPVSQQNNTITIEYKQYGISLAFVPTVIDGDHINLRVRPEVSQLSTQGAVQLGAGNSTISVPALTVRRADTTVELGSGESFAIAGLIQSQNTQGDSGIPYAGDIPVIGALFKSNNFERTQTELVIIVTPYIVRPTRNPNQLRAPTDSYVPPNDQDRVLFNRQLGRTPAAPPMPSTMSSMASPMPSTSAMQTAPAVYPQQMAQAQPVGRATLADVPGTPAALPAPMPLAQPMQPRAVLPNAAPELVSATLPSGAGFILK
jgi:pilus assembly protein CpaC